MSACGILRIFCVAILVAIAGSGCSESSSTAALQARIHALERQQKESNAKITAMGERIVTKQIEVDGFIRTRELSADIIQVGEKGTGSNVQIESSGLTVSSLVNGAKTGGTTEIASTSIIIRDHENDDSPFKGNIVSLGVSDVNSKGEREGRTRIFMRSNEAEPGGYGERLSLHETVRVPRRIEWSLEDKNEGFSFIGTDALVFAARLESISDDGILRFKVANASALEVGKVRGEVGYYVVKKPKFTAKANPSKSEPKTASFIIDRRMPPGKWEDVAIVLGASKEELEGYLSLSAIKVESFFFLK
jgi:hypothetical protein